MNNDQLLLELYNVACAEAIDELRRELLEKGDYLSLQKLTLWRNQAITPEINDSNQINNSFDSDKSGHQKSSRRLREAINHIE